MNMNIAKCLFSLSLILTMTGCKLALVVTSGGDVQSLSGIRDCAGGNLCEFQISDASFSDSFTAVPRAGYVFAYWQGGSGFLCGESTNPTCDVSNTAYAGNAAVEPIISSGLFFQAMPVFQFVGVDTDDDGIPNFLDEDDDNDGLLDADDPCPTNPDLACGGDVIAVNGKVWYQLDLFLGVTWAEVNAACAGGLCSGVVNGYNLDGWSWATDVDVLELLDYYGTLNLSQDCPAFYSFFADGWRETNTTISFPGVTFPAAGWISDGSNSLSYVGFVASENFNCNYGSYSNTQFLPDAGTAGAFFYYPPDP